MDRLPPVPGNQHLRPGPEAIAHAAADSSPDLDRSGLVAAARALGIELSDETATRLLRYAGLLRDWTRRINLIARRDTNRIASYHIVDSLAAVRFLPPTARVADIGSGAGLPGIPVAAVRPDITMHLVESSQRKGVFLREAVREINLDCVVVSQRLEATSPLGCDVLLSRITGPTVEVVPHCRRHLKAGGSLVLYKSSSAEPEPLLAGTDRLSALGFTPPETTDIVLPASGVVRRFVVLRRKTV